MQLKRRFTQLMVVGGLAVMTAGLSQAGGCGPCCWCGSPAPKAVAVSKAITPQPSLFSIVLTTVLALI